jgi:hypothetical protein
MTRHTAARRRARELQRAEGIGYHEALNRVRAGSTEPDAAPPAPVEQLLAIAYTRQPTPAEAAAGLTAEDLGVSVLPADATPAQRARAEALWCPAGADRPCRCSGTGCLHGTACPNHDDQDPCPGRLVHLDRHPGSLWGLTDWWDEYRCAECGERLGHGVELPELPWGELKPNGDGAGGTTLVYDGVRHPNFPDFDSDAGERSDGDGVCRGCGGYAFSGWLCNGCEADEYEDEHGRDCECGASHEYHCVC